MLVLHQFVSSHFNEKVRWALDLKGLDHRRVTYLPGFHVKPIRKLTGGPRSTPVLQIEGACISGSAAILDWLERQYPEPALYPRDLDLCSEALALQTRFDAELGPSTRTLVFAVLLHELGYLAATFGATKSWLTRFGYFAFLPLARPIITKINGVQPDNIERSRAITNACLDEIAKRVAKTGYLVGDRFSVADLTAASLLAPLTNVTHPDMRRHEPMPNAVSAFLAQWQDHPAIAWVQRIYAEHRPQPRQPN